MKLRINKNIKDFGFLSEQQRTKELGSGLEPDLVSSRAPKNHWTGWSLPSIEEMGQGPALMLTSAKSCLWNFL